MVDPTHALSLPYEHALPHTPGRQVHVLPTSQWPQVDTRPLQSMSSLHPEKEYMKRDDRRIVSVGEGEGGGGGY